MENNFKTTKEVMELLGCKKATFFAHQSKLGIQPHKKGNKNYYTEDQIKTFQNSLNSVPIQSGHSPDSDEQSPDDVQTNSDSPDTSQTNNDVLNEHFRQELERTRTELKEAQKEIQSLSGEVGRWQGKAQAYQELNQKLLLENSKKSLENFPEKKEERGEDNIIDAEVIPEAPAEDKTPEKKGWWARLFG